MQKLSKKYSIPKSTIQFYIALHKQKVIPTGQGCKPVLTKEQSKELNKCTVELAEMGFAPSIKDVRDIVGSYVQYNDLADTKMRL